MIYNDFYFGPFVRFSEPAPFDVWSDELKAYFEGHVDVSIRIMCSQGDGVYVSCPMAWMDSSSNCPVPINSEEIMAMVIQLSDFVRDVLGIESCIVQVGMFKITS